MASIAARQRLASAVNWFPGHMVNAAKEMKERLKAVDLIIEVRDARLPMSSANEQLEGLARGKRRLIVLNKRELANTTYEKQWGDHFVGRGERHMFVSAHHPKSVVKVLSAVKKWLAAERANEVTLLAMVVGVPNVGKSALINGLHRLGLPPLPEDRKKRKKAVVGPLPGVTRSVSSFKVAEKPSLYVLDTPGVMVPRVASVEVGLKLALIDAVKVSVVGEEHVARYLLSLLNSRQLALQARASDSRSHQSHALPQAAKPASSGGGARAHLAEALALPREELMQQLSEAEAGGIGKVFGSAAYGEAMEAHVDRQMALLRRKFHVAASEGDEGWNLVGRHVLRALREGKLGPCTLDIVPNIAKIHTDKG
eukprot:jgi/Mesen1/8258/ME000445S07397